MLKQQPRSVGPSKLIRDFGIAIGITAVGISILIIINAIDRNQALPIFSIFSIFNFLSRAIKEK